MAVIVLDRDGVINFDSSDYIRSAAAWIPIPGSIEAIALLSKFGYRIYVATNQSGLARGLFTPDDLDTIHNKLRSLVRHAGGEIAEIYFCPHHPNAGCNCRKPGIGLLQKIAAHCGEDLTGQPFVGDSLQDIQAAKTMGCKPILVLTGNGTKTLERCPTKPTTFNSLGHFSKALCKV